MNTSVSSLVFLGSTKTASIIFPIRGIKALQMIQSLGFSLMRHWHIELVISGGGPARKEILSIEDSFIAMAEVIRDFFASGLAIAALYVID